MACIIISSSHAAKITLAWDPSDGATGYKIYSGTETGKYKWVIDVGNSLSYTTLELTDGYNYYFAATAYNESEESDFSDEVSYTATPTEMYPVYQFYAYSNGDHYYTVEEKVKTLLQTQYSSVWKYEKISFYVYKKQVTGTIPVYQFICIQNGQHFYTASESEKDWLIANAPTIWKYEQVAFYVRPSGKAPVYRFYCLINGQHFYTASESEKDWLIANAPTIWKYEKIEFYQW